MSVTFRSAKPIDGQVLGLASDQKDPFGRPAPGDLPHAGLHHRLTRVHPHCAPAPPDHLEGEVSRADGDIQRQSTRWKAALPRREPPPPVVLAKAQQTVEEIIARRDPPKHHAQQVALLRSDGDLMFGV
jgi:hypothetical protein